jgi:hypothetical protein
MSDAMKIHSAFLHLLELYKAPPMTGLEAALSVAANLGVTTCKLSDKELDAMFQTWVRTVREQDRLMMS